MTPFMIFAAKYLVYLLIIAAIAFVFFQRKEIQKRMLVFGIISLPITYILAKIAGKLFYDPRPFVTSHIVPLIPHAPTNGFPSDHALISFAVAWIVFLHNKKLGIVFLLVALLIGIARVNVRVHSPIDIVGSFAISLTVAFLTEYALKLWIFRKNNI
jgi:undecaprenyl-diphosphatase